MKSLGDLFTYIGNQAQAIRFTDVLDILLVGVILFLLFRFMRERRAGKLAVGILLLFGLRVISGVCQMHMLGYLLDELFKVGLIALIVLFQPELRSALEKFGGQPMQSIRGLGEQKDTTEIQRVISQVCEACADMSESKTGALIVFERTTRLGDIVRTGTVINADVNASLLKNIFFNKAPMHDGATIIAKERIYSSGCFLPLSMNQDIIKDLGTRHRAGIGMSENSDAVVVIVSEETGKISTAVAGKLETGYSKEKLHAFLTKELIGDKPLGRFLKRRAPSAGDTSADTSADTSSDASEK